MGAPLYAGARAAAMFRPGASHAGLWYDKFCDGWNGDFTGFADDDAKRRWIAGLCRGRLGERAAIEAAGVRRRALVAARRGHWLELVTRGRFATGLGRAHPVENGFAWHPTLGTPFLAGAGLKGVARAWARDFLAVGDAPLARIFGPAGTAPRAAGAVAFLDLLPLSPVRMVVEVMTPHYGPWYDAARAGEAPADWHSPTPIPFPAVAENTRFAAAVMPVDPRRDAADCATATEWLKEALSTIGGGAKTASGMGRFTIAAHTPPPGWRYRDRPVEIIGDEEEGLVPVRYRDDGGEDFVPRAEIEAG